MARSISVWIFSLVLATVLGSSRAVASDRFPSPTVRDDRTIAVLAPRVVDRVRVSAPIETYVFKDIERSCALSPSEIANELNSLLAKDSLVYSTLKSLFPDPEKGISRLSLTILVDDFGARRALFNSLYLPEIPDHDGPVILLDCSIAAREYWGPTIAHEFTHALLHAYKVDSWFEEGLAQLIEEDAGGVQPAHEADLFRSARELPTLLEMRRPFPSGAAYAFSYLFAKYLRAQFGGWGVLRAMVGVDGGGDSPEVQSDRRLPFYDQALERGRAYLERNPAYSYLAEKFTGSGLLRFFAVALTLNSPDFSLYSVPGWRGFVTRQDSGMIAPFSFAMLEPNTPVTPSQRLERYWVNPSGPSGFEIRPLTGDAAPEKLDTGFLLVINPSAERIRF